MIPLQLTLKNFLSYRETILDFRGLHTACICGANGAGKSSLLEAITWVIWGECRAGTEDDVIHAGANNARVDFEFICHYQTYRIIRSRPRGKSTSVEFQVKTESGKFRSLTAKGLRATQQKIICDLKLDYDTFINSAYLRQGRADEFMLRRPNERKQILADLLKLDRYEELATQAKDLSKNYKGQAEQLELSLQPLKERLANRKAIAAEKTNLETQLRQLQQLQESDREQLQALQAKENQRQNWQQQLIWQQTQYQNLTQDCDRLLQERSLLNAQLTELEKLLAREAEISAGYQHLLSLQQQEETLSGKFQAYQDAQQQRQQLEKELNQQNNELNLQIRQTQTRLETLEQQEREIQQVLNTTSEVEAGLEKLNRYRQRLSELDRLQHHVSPLLQRRSTLQTEIETAKARLTARLEQLHSSEAHLSTQMERVPQMRQAVLEIDAEIGDLEKKRVRQKFVEEKGSERKSLRERLQANQRIYEQQWEELRQKLQMLEKPEATCPLCEQGLDEHYRHQVIDKTQKQQEEIQGYIWVIRDQLATCERELQILRQEYAQLSKELKIYDRLQQELGQLEAKLEATGESYSQLQEIKAKTEELERSLTVGKYARELHLELKQIDEELQRLNYDEQTHALVRGEEKRWRWAEIKQAKLEENKRRQAAIEAQKPNLQGKIASLRTSIAQLGQNSPIQRQLERVDCYLSELGYERSRHNQIIASVRQAQPWQLRHQELLQAQQQYPQLQGKLQQLEAMLQQRLFEQEVIKEQLDRLVKQMEAIADNREEIEVLEQQIYRRRQKLDELIAQQGRIEEQLKQLDNLQIQYQESSQQLKEIRKQHLVYKELAQAFGKNGIQALMIENVLPQLEAETNHILARLTGNQFHVQFLTQKIGRSSRSKKQAGKLIDTLDILIADARGTRAYETYSGGEAFRINFSIRLALARLLAQRAGTSLQMLIIDEGFGTQDREGCDRLIAAINAIAADFCCILTVTHMPQFKEAFQTRIEVYKTDQGSQLRLSN
ncbi:MAG: exonuclease subunit SbcC [Prochloraceae cyanobacterium]